MRKLYATGFLVVIVTLSVHSGKTLKCFVCDSSKHKGCGSNSTWIAECPAKKDAPSSKVYCRKIHQKLTFRDQNQYVTVRECAYQREHSRCYKLKWLQVARQETCECETEACNGGRGRGAGVLSLPLALCGAFHLLRG